MAVIIIDITYRLITEHFRIFPCASRMKYEKWQEYRMNKRRICCCFFFFKEMPLKSASEEFECTVFETFASSSKILLEQFKFNSYAIRCSHYTCKLSNYMFLLVSPRQTTKHLSLVSRDVNMTFDFSKCEYFVFIFFFLSISWITKWWDAVT